MSRNTVDGCLNVIEDWHFLWQCTSQYQKTEHHTGKHRRIHSFIYTNIYVYTFTWAYFWITHFVVYYPNILFTIYTQFRISHYTKSGRVRRVSQSVFGVLVQCISCKHIEVWYALFWLTFLTVCKHRDKQPGAELNWVELKWNWSPRIP